MTADQLAVIAPIAAPDRLAAAAAQGVDLAGIEEALVAIATGERYDRLGQAVEHYLNRLDPDGPEPDPTERRALHLTKHADGSVTGRFDLDAVGGEKVQTALEAHVQADRPAGDERSRAQQLGDALVQWADVTLAAGAAPVLRTHKPQVVVTIPLADLVGPHTGPGTGRMGFGAEISAARARWLACDGGITRVVIGPEGQPLDLGRTHRVFPWHIRRALEARDEGCVFAGCSAPTHWCDAHHLLEWVLDEGPTSVDNGALLCERHHTKVHHGFRIERDPRGRWRTYRPDGTEILRLRTSALLSHGRAQKSPLRPRRSRIAWSARARAAPSRARAGRPTTPRPTRPGWTPAWSPRASAHPASPVRALPTGRGSSRPR